MKDDLFQFAESFKLFSKFGGGSAGGKLISLSQSDKWLKQAKIIDGKNITTSDTSIIFKKFKALKLNQVDFKEYLNELAEAKNMKVEDIICKMVACGPPSLSPEAAATMYEQNFASPVFKRLTDTSHYTGASRFRFDENGKGRGLEGRWDMCSMDGYVQGYKNKGLYGKIKRQCLESQTRIMSPSSDGCYFFYRL